MSKTFTIRARFCCAAPFAQQKERIFPKRTRRSTKLSPEKLLPLAALTLTAGALELDWSTERPGGRDGRRPEASDDFGREKVQVQRRAITLMR